MNYSFIRKVFHAFLLLLCIGTIPNCFAEEASASIADSSGSVAKTGIASDLTNRKRRMISPKFIESLVGKEAIESESKLMKRAANPIPKKKKGSSVLDVFRKPKQ